MNTYYLGLDLNLPQSIKILKVKKELGFSGFGLYVELLLKLGQSPNYELATTDYDLLAYEFRLEAKYIKALVENYDLFIVKNGKFYCQDVKEKMQLLENKRKVASEAGKLGNEIRWGKVSGSDRTPTSGSDPKPHRNKGNKETKLNNKEIINNFFATQNLIELVQKKFVQLENQVWFEEQANNSLELIKENMIVYYEKKQIKNMKATFNNWLSNCKRTDFYKYLDQKSIIKESLAEKPYIESDFDRQERERKEKEDKFNALPEAEKQRIREKNAKALALVKEQIAKLKNKSIYD